MEWKTWQVYCLGKRSVLRFDLKESREGFCQRKRKVIPRSGAKTRLKAREPAVESLVQGIWRLRVSEVEQRVWEGA